MSSVQISGVIITFNEERNIAACIESMLPVVDEVLVVDSFSTDRTKEICLEMGVRFIEHEFKGHIEQKNHALDQANYNHILSLDADERLSEKMSQSILEVKKNWVHAAYSFNRLNNYCGAWLKWSWYPDRKIRLWDRRVGRWGGTNPHDKVVMNVSDAKQLKGEIIHYAYANLEEHYTQIKKFAIIAAESKFEQGKKSNFFIHVILNPWYKFFRKYILRLGFLDGYYGFIFSALTAYLNFLKYLRLWELNKNNGN